MASSPSDPYSRLQYRRLIAWPARIEREWPLLREVLESGPARRLLDLGCGTGEHARFLAAQGFEVVGVDRSEAQLEEARREADVNLRFVQGDLTEIGEIEDPALSPARFGGAVCLGNTLPHVTGREGLVRLAAGLRRLLLPGAPWVVQVLNYERIFARGERHLPLNFRPGDDGGELVFLRLLETREDGMVVFCPTTLRLATAEETPVEVVSSRRVLLRGWRRPELEEVLEEAGFARREAFGGYGREPYDPEASTDLLLIAR
jgi:SAM-dependent methyltransferase